MKAIVPHIFTVFTFVGIALGQGGVSNGLPSCSLGCFQQAVNESGCAVTDTFCQCTTGKDVITDQVTVCLESGQSSCSGSDLEDVISRSSAICSSVLAAGPPKSSTTTSASSSTSSPASKLAADATLTMSVAPSGAVLSSTTSAPAASLTAAATTNFGVEYRGVGLGLLGAIMGLLAF